MSALERLTAWRDSVDEPYSACYWPGPKTMDDPARAHQLVGRDADAAEIAYLVQDTNVVVLSGNSGVGKSSMLGMKIYPRLQELGFSIGMLRRFPPIVFHDGAASVADVSAAIRRALADEESRARKDVRISDPAFAEIPEDEDFIDWLERNYHKKALIILDQFEEVIRQQPQLFDAIHSWIDEVVSRSGVRILISLRSEYAYRLRTLVVGAYQRADVEIEPLQGAVDIPEVIRSGRRLDDAGSDEFGWEPVITDAAADRLYECWRLAGGDERTTPITLLHLQAVLFVLWSENEGRAILDVDAVDRLAGGNVTTPGCARTLFDRSLSRVLDLHFASCAAAIPLLHDGLFTDEPLLYGTSALLTRIAPLLSSGGYKIEQGLADLARSAFERRDEGSHADSAEMAQGVSRRATDEVLASWLAEPFSLQPDELWTDAASEYSAGVLAGASPAAVRFHLVRCFQFALEWLRSGQLARFVSDSSGGEAVELAHDGFGDALRSWAKRSGSRPEIDVFEVRRIVGASLSWRADQDFFVGTRAPGGLRLVTNVAWTSSRIRSTRFERVVFMNCDFSDSKFEGCTFHGVTFVNCILDGVAFDRCVVEGSAIPPTRVLSRSEREALPSAPAFATLGHPALDAGVDDFVALQNHYGRETVDPADAWVFSETSGVPAVAATASDPRRDTVLGWIDQAGGLAFCGGRLSSLAFMSCSGTSSGSVLLREVVGTSVDFAEQSDLRIEIEDAVLRGITVSPDVRVHGGRFEVTAPTITFEARRCHLENTWFSAGLGGTASIDDCVVWQLFCGSPDFEVTLTNTGYGGVVNVRDPDLDPDNLPIPGFSHPSEALLAEVEKHARNVDYRSRDVRDQVERRESAE